MIETLSLQECLRLTYQHPGLVVGPSATSHVASISELRQKIVATIAPVVIPERFTNHYEAVDYIRQFHADKSQDVETLVRQFFAEIHASPNVTHLVGGRWSLVISLASDLHLESQLHAHLDKTPSSLTVTVVTHPSIVPPANTLPIYKLLGSHRDLRPDHTIAVSTSDLLRRRQHWRKMLLSVADYLRDAPLLFAGTETQLALVRELLTELYGNGPPYPSRLVFLQSDPALDDPTILGLISAHSRVVRVETTLRDFCEATTSAQPTRLAFATESFRLPVRNSRLAMVIEDYRGMIDLVPTGLPDGFDQRGNHLRLIDGLFRPISLDWLPFLCDYDMKRSEVKEIEEAVAVKKNYIEQQAHPCILVKGEAGIGKTTTAKRVAVELAKQGDIVLWCKKSPAYSPGAIRKLAISVREAINTNDELKGKQLIVICDDPWGSRVSPLELVSAFESSGLSAVFLFFVRLTDLISDGHERLSFPGLPDEEIQLQYHLTTDDIEELKLLLVRVNVATDEADAQAKINNMPTKNSDDVLCSLWYLLPHTHSQLSGSIQDEYGRLGIADAVREFASRANSLGERARLAYELVAVTSNLDIGLPLELLLRTTGASYDDWISSSKDGEPLWGLLYDDLDSEAGTLLYYTRNEIVTRVLLEIVNGGLGHAGEFRRLKQLVANCSLGNAPYRNFLSDLLGRSRSKLMTILSYEQGLELYELALENFPEADRHLRYRYGLWKHHAGRDHVGAYAEYQKALDTPDYMYASRTEPDEHIHTSSAAAVVARVKEGSQDPQNGLALVQQHLRHASHPRYFNPHTAHVFANLFYQISRRSRDNHEVEVTLESYSEALRTIERTLQTIGADGRKQVQYAKDIRMFQELQTEILESIGDIEQTKEYATNCYNSTRLQTGFEVVGRKLLATAIRSNKGADFKTANDYLDDVRQIITNASDQPSVDLLAFRVDLIVRWRLQQTRGEINWSELRDWLEIIVGNQKYRDDYLKLYYYGVALFHCEDYSKANAVFENMRTRIRPHERVRRSVRNYLVGKEGFARRLQGTLKEAHGRLYVFSSDLGVDIYVGRREVEVQPNAVVHFYVAFTMEGPRAVFEPPEKLDLVIP
ncbi:MAG: ATP-binding protein [Pirellulales bacterium]